jgi:hypothetical protein
MNNAFYKSPKMWKDSAVFAFALLAGIESVMSIAAISIYDCIDSWWVRLLIIFAAYCVLIVSVFIIKYLFSRNEITLSVRGISVTVKQGDIFKAGDWKLIPFNEYYDTTVDDVVIAKNSLNGKLILEHLDNSGIAELVNIIEADDSSPFVREYDEKAQKWRYPLGRIKTFRDYMILALTRFNAQNEAHTTRSEYEHSLRIMWQEISRTYANKPIHIPLVGSGITRFDDMTQKSNSELLKCILCTLRTSNVTINQPICHATR